MKSESALKIARISPSSQLPFIAKEEVFILSVSKKSKELFCRQFRLLCKCMNTDKLALLSLPEQLSLHDTPPPYPALIPVSQSKSRDSVPGLREISQH